MQRSTTYLVLHRNAVTILLAAGTPMMLFAPPNVRQTRKLIFQQE